jgi:conjugative relaxase-like TrwC/TraI family protein
MLRIIPIKDAKQAASYYSKSDGGYYLDPDDLRREWGGKGAAMLGLSGPPDYEHFKRLIDGLDPHTGKQLTAQLIENRIPGWDINVHCPKGVTVALEWGDNRIHDALWDAAREAMADVEAMASTRVRKDGQQDDRLTGNLVWYGVEHPETRPAKEDQMPDPHRHIHFVVMNLTRDDVEGEWKALKVRKVMEQRKYLDRRFNMRFASKLADLGYEVETKWRFDDRGRRKYVGWDIAGVPDSVLTKFSRRSEEVKGAERAAVEANKGRDEARGLDPEKTPDELSAVARDKLGATSRLHKRDDMTLADYRRYWDTRVTPEERREIAETIKAALLGQNPRPDSQLEPAMSFAIGKEFYHHSVVPYENLAITAMERGMGTVLPDQIEPEARRQGVLFKNGEVTTADVLAEEHAIIGMARAGRGTLRPLAPDHTLIRTWLDGGQKRLVGQVLTLPDKYMLVRGPAGAGKTTALEELRDQFHAAGRRVIAIAQSGGASRGVLRDAGFKDAETIATFLGNKDMQESARGQVILLDEGSQVGMRTLREVMDVTERVGGRLVIVGDKRQHGPVERGSILHVLEDFAGLPVAELTEIRRQQGEYRNAVASMAAGDVLAGFDRLKEMGWVKMTPVWEHNKPIVDEYLEAIDGRKTALVIAPTHREGDEITAEIRKRLKEKEIIKGEERTFSQLRPLCGWTEAERGDPSQYSGNETVQFMRNTGPFKAGQKVKAADLLASGEKLRPKNFSVYAPGEVAIAAGDTIRPTVTLWTKGRAHRIENGSTHQVAGFTDDGDIRLKNGWVLAKDAGHLAHAYVSTSHASQGKTVDRVLIGMGSESRGAINGEQLYVSVSRGREKATIFSDLSAHELREAIKRSDQRKSAVELMGMPALAPRSFMQLVRQAYRQLRERAADAIRELTKQPERDLGYAR